MDEPDIIKVPLGISKRRYTKLIRDLYQGPLKPNDFKLLEKALQAKLCNCIADLEHSPRSRRKPGFPYAVCTNSIYNQRKFRRYATKDPPSPSPRDRAIVATFRGDPRICKDLKKKSRRHRNARRHKHVDRDPTS